MNNLKEEAKDTLKSNVSEMKKSGQDWFEYIQSHPLQSVLFGITVYFAIKGMFKE